MSEPIIEHPGEYRWETRLLALITGVLTVFGIASMSSATSLQEPGLSLAWRQLVGALAGAIIMLTVARIDYSIWRRAAWPLMGLTIALLVLSLLPFTKSITPVINQARRWVVIGPLSFQTSEMARFTLVIWAAMLAVKKGPEIRNLRRGVIPFLVIFGLVALLVLRQPNLSMATMLMLLGSVVLFTAGAKIGQFLFLGAAGGLVLLRKILDTGYRNERLLAFLNPESSLNDAGLQAYQSLVGIGSGGWLGVGFGEGQQKLNYLPYAYSDFLFSSIGEEWGFVGLAMVVSLFSLFCWVGFRIARTAPDPFGQLVAAGLTASVGLNAVMHMAVSLNLMPTTGLPLPFMSYGRSNIVVNLLSVGVILSVGRMRGRVPKARR